MLFTSYPLVLSWQYLRCCTDKIHSVMLYLERFKVLQIVPDEKYCQQESGVRGDDDCKQE